MGTFSRDRVRDRLRYNPASLEVVPFREKEERDGHCTGTVSLDSAGR